MIQNFLAIIVKFGSTFLFVLLEILCLYLIVKNNNDQGAIWSNSSNIVVGNITSKYNELTNFINLKDENEKLALENANLRSQLIARNYSKEVQDSLLASSYSFTPALIINNSTSKINNKITLNKGLLDGIRKGMGVISPNGVVGVITHVNSRFCIANSILNRQSKISGMLKRTRSLGDLNWDGKKPSHVKMNSVPQYIPLLLGDTIITSGYSTVFPKGHLVGTISSFESNNRTGYYDIEVELGVDLTGLEHVYIVDNVLHTNINQIQEDVGE